MHKTVAWFDGRWKWAVSFLAVGLFLVITGTPWDAYVTGRTSVPTGIERENMELANLGLVLLAVVFAWGMADLLLHGLVRLSGRSPDGFPGKEGQERRM